MDILNRLKAYWIDVDSTKYRAIESANALNASPDQSRAIIATLLDTNTNDERVLAVGDAEARKTSLYLIEQAFDPMADLDLETAQIKALELIDRYPHILTAQNTVEEQDEDGNTKPAAPEINRKAMALSLYREHKDKITANKELAAIFVEQIPGMSMSTANVYASNIRNSKKGWTL